MTFKPFRIYINNAIHNHILFHLLMVLLHHTIPEKRRASEKRCVEIEDWGFLVYVELGLQEVFIYTLHFCFRADIAKWCKVYTKNWLLVSKNIWGIWTTSDQQWKVQKVEIRWDELLLFEKYMYWAKTCTGDFFAVLMYALCTAAPDILSTRKNINSIVRVSYGLLFRFLWLGLLR